MPFHCGDPACCMIWVRVPSACYSLASKMRNGGLASNPIAGNSRDIRTFLVLLAATAVLCFGALFVSTPIAQEDALERRHELIFILLLGLLGIFCALRSRRRIRWPLVLLPCYIAFQ